MSTVIRRSWLGRLALPILLVLTIVPLARADSGPAHRGRLSRPIALGVSGLNSQAGCFSGTLGALVRGKGSRQYILSNNHVLARLNNGKAGKGQQGDDIVQPGLADAGCGVQPADAVADLAKFRRIRFARLGDLVPPPPRRANVVDAAIARVRHGAAREDGAILDIGTISDRTATGTIGCAVKKSGRTTGLTAGTISAIDVDARVEYDPFTFAWFRDQLRITPGSFSAAGDSGALVVRDTPGAPRAVGLLFAGGDEDTLASPIGPVLAAFGTLSLVGSGDGSGDCQAALGAAALDAPRAARSRYTAALHGDPNVVGTGVGAGGAVEVYLAREDPATRARIPTTLDDVPVRAVVTGPFRAR